MRLDARILKNPLSGFEFKLAEQFIGKSGYFGHMVEDFFHLDKLRHGELLRIGEYNGDFYYGENTFDFCEYFLPDEYVNLVEPIKDDITLAQLLSKLEVLRCNRVVIYDTSGDMVFDSDVSDPLAFNYYDYWKLLEEKVYRFADTKIDGKRNIFIFMGP